MSVVSKGLYKDLRAPKISKKSMTLQLEYNHCMIKIQQVGIIIIANNTLQSSVAGGIPKKAKCVRWTLEYKGNFNNWKLEVYGLDQGYGISYSTGREKHNVFGINLTSFCYTQRTVVRVGDAMGRTTNWKYLVFCRKVPESTGQYQIQIFRGKFWKTDQIPGIQREAEKDNLTLMGR